MFYPLDQLSRLYDGYKKAFKVANGSVLLLQEDGQVFIIENRCPHMDVPLESGTLLPAQSIRCRAHGIEFDLNTGSAKGALASTLDCLKKFEPIYEGTQVGVDI